MCFNINNVLPIYDKEEIYEFVIKGYEEARRGCIKDWYLIPTSDDKGNQCEELFAVIQDVDNGFIYRVPRIHVIMGEYLGDPAGIMPKKEFELGEPSSMPKKDFKWHNLLPCGDMPWDD